MEKAMRPNGSAHRIFVLTTGLLMAFMGFGCTDSSDDPVSQPNVPPPDLQTELESILGSPNEKTSTNFKVIEVLEAGRYTYAKLNDARGDRWVAAPKTSVAVGDTVAVGNAALMENFTSPSLKRTFDQIHFANEIIVVGGKAGSVPGKKPVEAPKAVQVDPAAGGVTVEMVLSKPADFTAKPVRLRGQVVKFNAQIMGRNWIHIQDGSGSASKGTHDLTITTDATVRVGQTIEVVGNLVQNKDFGAGYNYPVLLQGATVKVLP